MLLTPWEIMAGGRRGRQEEEKMREDWRYRKRKKGREIRQGEKESTERRKDYTTKAKGGEEKEDCERK